MTMAILASDPADAVDAASHVSYLVASKNDLRPAGRAERGFGWIRKTFAIFLAFLASLAGPSTVAAGTWIDYLADGFNSHNGLFRTAGYAPRLTNRVWHEAGYRWYLYYCGQTSCTSAVSSTSNPSVDTRDHSYAISYCERRDGHWGFVAVQCETEKS